MPLKVNQLQYPGGGVDPATITFIGSNSSTANSTSYTFSAQGIGTAAADRLVIVGVVGNSGSAHSISGVTIGGVSANLVIQQAAAGNTALGLYALLVTSGTTADIVVTFDTTSGLCGIGVWNANKLLSTTATDSDRAVGTDPVNAQINVSAGGVALACSAARNGTSTAWTGLTESADFVIESLINFSTAQLAFAAAQTGLTVDANFSPGGTSQQAIAMAAFR